MGKSEKREKKSKKKHKHKKDKEKSKHKSKDSKKSKRKSLHNKEQRKAETHEKSEPELAADKDASNGFEIPIELMNNKSHAPLTPAEYQHKQSQIRRVVDPTTGRIRLIRGDGEVLEEIVSKERHTEINKAATAKDGEFFQERTVVGAIKRRK